LANKQSFEIVKEERLHRSKKRSFRHHLKLARYDPNATLALASTSKSRGR
jgi:hypothetical protein